MHLTEALVDRAEPFGGVYFTVTRRCPLNCAHCSTNSGMKSEQHDEAIFTRFARSIKDASPELRPRVAGLTGGEPLLRPELCVELLEVLSAAHVRTVVATGLYFARSKTVPKAIRTVIRKTDLMMFSLDVFHERELARNDIARTVHSILDDGIDVAVQLVGTDRYDPYLADAIDWILNEFSSRVPALVALLKPIGRAANLPEAISTKSIGPESANELDPCAFASWPIVAPDGRIVACGNQNAVDVAKPGHHLYLGHAATDSWLQVRENGLSDSLLRCIRTLGPSSVSLGSDASRNHRENMSSCDACLKRLPDMTVHDRRRVEERMTTPGMRVIESEVSDLRRQEIGSLIPEPFRELAKVGLQ